MMGRGNNKVQSNVSVKGWAVDTARQSLRADRQGGVAVIFALSSTVLIGLAGGGIDYARLSARRSQLQNALDNGVLAGGNALKLASATPASVSGITEQAIRSGVTSPPDRPLSVQITVPNDKTSVTATASEEFKLAFGPFVGVRTAHISLRAKANVIGNMRLCMLTLDPAAPGAFDLEKSAQVTASGCSLYSNSSNPQGMLGQDSSYARAQTICSAGGFFGARANFAPPPQTGCPVIKDPLQDRPTPTVDACTSIPASANSKGDTSKNLADQSTPLSPGTYCGGLHITKNAIVSLQPGIYVMKDGPLIVDKNGSLSGIDVGFYFTGNKGGLLFDQKTAISLAAPTTGVMAGLLMMEERAVSDPVDPTLDVVQDILAPTSPTPPPLGATKPMRTYRIISDNARTMLGTIYLPAGRVVIDAKKPVADQSAYTVIVAQQVNLYKGPNLYLNANYDATSVPVPKGVGPISGKLLITQ
ncbi:TadE/TadG family type IV pilus assembly protein [Methylobacterium tardum]|uniref:TadE/TadG family type IV pilus assembly protein n=1 Tax=Methylobacterium tardum TaxID=374432 RepID=UPI0020202656|nr:Tad domain-containing protein [Methylobacterium tardum]URD38167.1 Tad domain-containing protein [Methylobacterium tardum]